MVAGFKDKKNRFRRIVRRNNKISDTELQNTMSSKSVNLGTGTLHNLIPMRFNKRYLSMAWLNKFTDESRKKLLLDIGLSDDDADFFKHDTIHTIIKETQDPQIMYDLWNVINLKPNMMGEDNERR